MLVLIKLCIENHNEINVTFIYLKEIIGINEYFRFRGSDLVGLYVHVSTLELYKSSARVATMVLCVGPIRFYGFPSVEKIKVIIRKRGR